jgi:undecaprenyl-diphosphatase
MLLNHRRALRFAAGCLLGAAALFALVAYPPTLAVVQRVDDGWLRLMKDLRNPVFVAVAKAFAFLGSVWINWPLRIAALVILAVKRRWLQLAAFALAVATSEALIGPVKGLYARPRPPDGLLHSASFAFPSGHAVAGAVTAVGLVLVLLPPGPKRWSWEIRAAVFAALMAVSRTYLAVHWLSDVVAGGLAGTGLAVGWPALLQELRNRWHARNARAPAYDGPAEGPAADGLAPEGSPGEASPRGESAEPASGTTL